MPVRAPRRRYRTITGGWRTRSLVLAAALLLCGCSSSAPKPRPQATTAAARATSSAAGPAAVTASPGRASPTPAPLGVFASLLQLIPDTPETRQQTTLDDYARIRQLFGIAAPADPADPDQQRAYIGAFAQHMPRGLFPTFSSGLGNYALETGYLARYLGERRVDQDAAAGLPPRIYEAVRGQFDPQEAARQIAAWQQQDPDHGCPDCPPAQTATYDGVSYYAWDEDFRTGLQHILTPPAFDQLGRGGRIAITPTFVLRALWTDGLQQMIVAAHGGSSLATNADFRLAADSLERLGTFGAFFTGRTQSRGRIADSLAANGLAPAQRARITAILTPPAGTPILEPYTLVAVGVGQGADGQPFTGIVLIHATEQAAQQNAVLLPQRIAQTSSVASGQPWSSILPHVQTSVSGRALLVALADSGIGPDFLIRDDPLLLHR